MSKFGIGLICILAIVLAFGNAFAMSSAKGSAAITDLQLVETHSWDPILSTYIKVAQQKELVFNVALQCGLYTLTRVKSKGGTKDTSSATATINVHIKYQPFYGFNEVGEEILGEAKYAHPGGEYDGVIFASRTQELEAKFGGIINSCTDADGNGTIDFKTECDVTEEELQLTLNTLNANAFNFIAPNLESGDYKVTVEAEITTDTSSEAGSANAWGLVGLGSMVVDEVRFIQGDRGGAP